MFCHHRQIWPWIGALLALATMVGPIFAQQWHEAGTGQMPMSPVVTSGVENWQRPVVPGPPMQPSPAIRPEAWPTDQPRESSPWPPVEPIGELQPCDGARIIGRVGQQAILESEVAGAVNEILEKNKDRIPPDQIETQRELLIQQRLKTLIETKLIFQDAKRTIPADNWSNVENQLSKHFEETELDKLMKKAGVSSRMEFDQKLRSLGTSLEREKRAFIERTLAGQWVAQQIKRDEEITYDQMVAFYREHISEFTTPERARWEELMVRYSKYPNRAAARDAIARLGNQVLAGMAFADVARIGSDGPTAQDGGRRDWTTRGSLVCEELDKAIFDLPIGQLSPIIEGPTGFHIIRVTERQPAVVRPFLEAQVDIKQKIIQERSQKQFKAYMAKLETRTPVWTIFDQPGNKSQLATPHPPLRR